MTAPGLEGLTVARYIYNTLTNDPQLQQLAGGKAALEKRVVEAEYTGTAPWWLVFTLLEPRDLKVVGMIHVAAEVQFQLKAVGAGTSYAVVEAPYARAHALLEGRTNVTQGQGLVLASHRVSGVQYPERTDGIEYRHLGGLYETLTQ